MPYAGRMWGRFLSLFALSIILLPASASAVSVVDCSDAVEMDPTDVVSMAYVDGVEAMADVRNNLGGWWPFSGGAMCLISSGDTANIETMTDLDWPGTGSDTSAGDKVTIQWQVQVPPWAHSFFLRSSFFSREYPEWVGHQYNDTLELWVDGAAWSGQALYDQNGDPIQVNNVLFTVTNPADLLGTGFDADGATGWIVTSVPVQPLDVVTLEVSIYDVADGVWDSAALLDHFEWSQNVVNLPYTTHADDDGYPIGEIPWEPPVDGGYAAYASPKTVPLEGGVEVEIVGGRLAPGVTVFVGAVGVPVEVLSSERMWIRRCPARRRRGCPREGPWRSASTATCSRTLWCTSTRRSDRSSTPPRSRKGGTGGSWR